MNNLCKLPKRARHYTQRRGAWVGDAETEMVVLVSGWISIVDKNDVMKKSKGVGKT